MARISSPLVAQRVILASCFVVSALALNRIHHSIRPPSGPLSEDRSGRLNVTPQLKSGHQIVAVVLAASWCVGSQGAGFQRNVAEMQDSLGKKAVRDGESLSMLGVALDWSIPDGVAYLGHLGRFDQIMVGGNWLNEGALRYIWRDSAGVPVLPQVVLLDRWIGIANVITARARDTSTQALSIDSERVVARMLGPKAISDWVHARERGLPSLMAR